jgi:hypothetical protein
MSEHLEQCTVIEWARLNEERYPALKLLFAVPNGGQRHKAVAVKLKNEGVKSGVPDLILPVHHESGFIWDEYHGLAIEMKDGKNKPTENQQWWLNELSRQGWYTMVCKSADEAIMLLERYLEPTA